MNGSFPEKIIIYRDGVSDGQLALVKDSEIPQIEKAFKALDPNYKLFFWHQFSSFYIINN